MSALDFEIIIYIIAVVGTTKSVCECIFMYHNKHFNRVYIKWIVFAYYLSSFPRSFHFIIFFTTKKRSFVVYLSEKFHYTIGNAKVVPNTGEKDDEWMEKIYLMG